MDWNTIGSIGGLMALIVGAAVVYLRLFVAQEIGKSEDSIKEHIDRKYANKEIMNLRLDGIESRLQNGR